MSKKPAHLPRNTSNIDAQAFLLRESMEGPEITASLSFLLDEGMKIKPCGCKELLPVSPACLKAFYSVSYMSYTYICIQNIWVFPVLRIYNLYLFIMLYLLKHQRFVFHIQFPCFGFYSVIFCTHITLLHTCDCNSGAGRQLTPSTVCHWVLLPLILKAKLCLMHIIPTWVQKADRRVTREDEQKRRGEWEGQDLREER